MSAIEDIRRRNLEALVAELDPGGQAKLARKLDGMDPNQVNGWLGKGTPRNMSGPSARKVELKLGKPKGWLDVDHSSEQSGSPSQAVGLQRSIVSAAVRLAAHVRDVSIDDIPDERYPDILFECMQVVARIGPDSIADGTGIAQAAKEVAAAIRSR